MESLRVQSSLHYLKPLVSARARSPTKERPETSVSKIIEKAIYLQKKRYRTTKKMREKTIMISSQDPPVKKCTGHSDRTKNEREFDRYFRKQKSQAKQYTSLKQPVKQNKYMEEDLQHMQERKERPQVVIKDFVLKYDEDVLKSTERREKKLGQQQHQ